MKTLIIECRHGKGAPFDEIEEKLTQAGACPIEGFDPVLMPGQDHDETLIFTMNVPDNDTVEADIQNLEDVIQVFGSPTIAKYSCQSTS